MTRDSLTGSLEREGFSADSSTGVHIRHHAKAMKADGPRYFCFCGGGDVCSLVGGTMFLIRM